MHIGPAADDLIVRVYKCISVDDCVLSIRYSESNLYTICNNERECIRWGVSGNSLD
jgi:hypothetical protein